MNWIFHKLKLVDAFLNDVLGDIKSLRFQLVIIAVGLNIWVINKVICCNLHYSISLACVGLLTAVFAFYFASKSKENEIRIAQGDPPRGVNPDELS